jgi:hypothetical protein
VLMARGRNAIPWQQNWHRHSARNTDRPDRNRRVMGGNYSLALAGTAGVVTIVIIISTLLVSLGRETRDV